jgi:hypothetical protein
MSSLTGLVIIMVIAAAIVTLCFMQDMGLIHLPSRSRGRNPR